MEVTATRAAAAAPPPTASDGSGGSSGGSGGSSNNSGGAALAVQRRRRRRRRRRWRQRRRRRQRRRLVTAAATKPTRSTAGDDTSAATAAAAEAARAAAATRAAGVAAGARVPTRPGARSAQGAGACVVPGVCACSEGFAGQRDDHLAADGTGPAAARPPRRGRVHRPTRRRWSEPSTARLSARVSTLPRRAPLAGDARRLALRISQKCRRRVCGRARSSARSVRCRCRGRRPPFPMPEADLSPRSPPSRAPPAHRRQYLARGALARGASGDECVGGGQPGGVEEAADWWEGPPSPPTAVGRRRWRWAGRRASSPDGSSARGCTARSQTCSRVRSSPERRSSSSPARSRRARDDGIRLRRPHRLRRLPSATATWWGSSRRSHSIFIGFA